MKLSVFASPLEGRLLCEGASVPCISRDVTHGVVQVPCFAPWAVLLVPLWIALYLLVRLIASALTDEYDPRACDPTLPAFFSIHHAGAQDSHCPWPFDCQTRSAASSCLPAHELVQLRANLGSGALALHTDLS